MFSSNFNFAQDNTLYFMHDIPQSISLNPAVNFRCNFYIEVPLLSSLQFGYNNNGFGFNDFIHRGTGARSDSFVYDPVKLSSTLQKINFIRTDLGINLLGFGFRRGYYYFSFSMSNRSEGILTYGKDLLLLKDGNWDLTSGVGITRDLGGIGINLVNYTQISFGVSAQVDRNLRVGVRLNYLKGTANLTTTKSDLSLVTVTSPVSVAFNTDIELNASMPMNLKRDSFSRVEGFNPNFSNPIHDFIFNSNRGVSVDAGMIYRTDYGVDLMASIVDLGFIYWSSNIENFESKGYFQFNGIDLSNYQINSNNADLIRQLKDSLNNAFKFYNNPQSYTTYLTTKIFAGAIFHINEKIFASILNKNLVFNSAIHSTLTLAVNDHFMKNFEGTISLSAMNNNFLNTGFGLMYKIGSFQIYFVSDNIPVTYIKDSGTGLLIPFEAHTMDFHFGCNLTFGCKTVSYKARGKTAIPCPDVYAKKKPMTKKSKVKRKSKILEWMGF